MKVAYSVNKVPIRLSLERWRHISDNHPELSGKMNDVLNAIRKPDIIFSGESDEYLAVKIKDHWIVVVYRELSKQDGFIITAFITSRISYLLKKEIVWQNPSLNK